MVDYQYAHPAAIDPQSLLARCDIRRSRASGPGGQHRSKVQTAITIRHRQTGIEGAASERRSQAQNQQKALFRLRINLALAVRQPIDPTQHPTPLWQSRCTNGRLGVNPEHPDFPAILAEAMDVLTAHAMDPKLAATNLGCTTTQFMKLFHAQPKALVLINEIRNEQGLGPLH